MESWGGGGAALLYGSPESSTGDEKFRAMLSKEFYQKNTVAVACDVVYILLFFGENIICLPERGLVIVPFYHSYFLKTFLL